MHLNIMWPWAGLVLTLNLRFLVCKGCPLIPDKKHAAGGFEMWVFVGSDVPVSWSLRWRVSQSTVPWVYLSASSVPWQLHTAVWGRSPPTPSLSCEYQCPVAQVAPPKLAALSLTLGLGIGFRPTLPSSGRFTVAWGGTGQGLRAIQLFLNLRAPSFQLSLESSTFSSWGSSTVTQAGTAQQLGVNGAAAGACSILLVVRGKPACLRLLQWWQWGLRAASSELPREGLG